MAGCFPEKPRWCLSEQVCPGSKVYSALSNPEDWILQYIRTYLLSLQILNNLEEMVIKKAHQWLYLEETLLC